MKVSLIITVYNRPRELELVLKSIESQSYKPHEVVIADDGSNIDTQNFINQYSNQTELNIIHSYQNDKGFRASRSRNKAVLKSSGDYLVFIDGDVILHRRFIENHVKKSKFGYFLQGKRVLISEMKTKEILESEFLKPRLFSKGFKNKHNSIYFPYLPSLIYSSKQRLNGIKTCNFSIHREIYFIVNGFNNEIEGWGREDSEFVSRLYNYGIRRRDLRFCAIQYHLFHREYSRKSLRLNDKILQESINLSITACQNGVSQL